MRTLYLLLIILFVNNIYADEIISPNEKAEIELLKIIDYMRNGSNEEALFIAEKLSKNYPNFKLGKVIYADLLSSHLQKKPVLSSKSKDKKINDLKSEAKARINFTSVYKKNDLLPKSIVQLSDNVKYAFLIELSKSRLYLVKNNSGIPEIIADYYVSIGKGGYNKSISGDNKTPIGVYKITSHLIDEDLPELYGNGAYPINYPNSWDIRNNKTGYGIWIHGVPRDVYSRPPLTSEGCVVTSNRTLQKLKKYTEIGKTPVLLVENVNWIKRNKWHQNKEEANNFIKEWEKSWESLDPHSFIAQHSINFNSKTHDFEKRVAHILRIIGNKTFIKINIKNLNLFFYPEQRNLIYADFRQFYESNNFKTATNKKLFWKKEKDGKWRIIYEDT
ncbi:MAG: L,D-transpeptidase [Gammaproteobacteria bacterium]|jgi:murein L,D-transpeptidase YafK|nr:L,D-transpeptidase [Gammaproteobacteria bacterium]MBT7603843.1 L,D-transpeptidase [Gammaproteobacteria bacterium]